MRALIFIAMWLLALPVAAAQEDDEVVITLYQLNNAPVFVDGTDTRIELAENQYAVAVDPSDATRATVTLSASVFTTAIDDIDLGAQLGVAITEWGSIVVPPYTVLPTSARVVPIPGGTISFTVTLPPPGTGAEVFRIRVWDRTDAAITYGDATQTGGRNAYSSNIKWVYIPNFQPPPPPPPPPTLVRTDPVPAPYALGNLGQNPFNTGIRVDALIARLHTAGARGVAELAPGIVVQAIDEATVPGAVQWKLEGGFWQDLASLGSSALLLPPTASLRFGPAGQSAGLQPPLVAEDVIAGSVLTAWPAGRQPGEIVTIGSLAVAQDGYRLPFDCIPVNDAPRVQDRAWSVRVPVNPGARSASLFGDMSPGPADESAQTTTAEVVQLIDSQDLFAVAPTVDAATGVVHFTGKNGVAGSALLYYRVRDNGGTAYGGVDRTRELPFIINIGNANSPPIVVPPTQEVTCRVGSPISVTIMAYEPENEPVGASYLAMGQRGLLGRIQVTQQAPASLTPAIISFTYTPKQQGDETIYVVVTDTNRLEAQAAVTFHVQPPSPQVDRPLIVSRPRYFWEQGVPWVYSVLTERERLGLPVNLTYELLVAPEGAVMTANQVVWDTANARTTAPTADPVHRFVIRVRDTDDPTKMDTIQVLVAPLDASLRAPAGGGNG